MINVPKVGERWLGQGGYYAGILKGCEGLPDQHLIVASPESDGVDLEWRVLDIETKGASSRWDGRANSLALIESDENYPAALFASSYSCEGHNDYHLGSCAEMDLSKDNVPELFEKKWYWTSTQYSAFGVWTKDFNNTGQSVTVKNYKGCVRPVRWIPVQ